jgi:hypothetical protein
MSPTNSPNSQETNEQIVNDIQTLQTMEQQIFSNLENNPNLTVQQQKEIVEKMNQLSNMRINLYQTLSGVNNYYQNALYSSQGTLQEQTAAIYIVENELNTAKRRLEALDVEKTNKIRLVEINNYYGDKYAEHGNLMKIIIFTLVPVIILAILNNSGILPNAIYYILVMIIAAIGAYFFWLRFGSIITRDTMNYQTYDWYFDPTTAPTGSAISSTDPWLSLGSIGTCIGQDCCSAGQMYDETLDQCVGSSTAAPSSTDTYATQPTQTTTPSSTTNTTTASTTTTTESFITEAMVERMLTKQEHGKYKADFVYDGNNRIQPNEPYSFIYKN